MVRHENALINKAVSLKGKFPALHADYIPKRDFLNSDQKNAVKEILTTHDGVIAYYVEKQAKINVLSLSLRSLISRTVSPFFDDGYRGYMFLFLLKKTLLKKRICKLIDGFGLNNSCYFKI